MAKDDNVVRCKVVETAGIKFWFPLDKPEKAIFMVDTTVIPHVDADLRENPSFYCILPCPYCGVEADRNHEPKAHTIQGKQAVNVPITKRHFKFIATNGHDFAMVPGETEEAAQKLLLSNSPFYTFTKVERVDPPIHNEEVT